MDAKVEVLDEEVKPARGFKAKSRTVLARLAKGLMFWVIEVITVLLLAAGVFYYYYDSQPTYSAADARTCVLTAGSHILTGERMYFYNYKEIFGWRLIDVSTIEESTMYDVEGFALTVVGVKDGAKWFSTKHELGETGYRPLGDAASYTFIINGVPAVTSYDDFCE